VGDEVVLPTLLHYCREEHLSARRVEVLQISIEFEEGWYDMESTSGKMNYSVLDRVCDSLDFDAERCMKLL
jgi:hypothetical protein